LADQAEIYLAAVTGAGVPLRLGRMRWIAPAGQTAALIALSRSVEPPSVHAVTWCRSHIDRQDLRDQTGYAVTGAGSLIPINNRIRGALAAATHRRQ
jgi:hypothetical protein